MGNSHSSCDDEHALALKAVTREITSRPSSDERLIKELRRIMTALESARSPTRQDIRYVEQAVRHVEACDARAHSVTSQAPLLGTGAERRRTRTHQAQR